jgi:SAM-dependent methyltransferase
MNTDWWRPEELVSSESNTHQINDHDMLSVRGDFGSYKIMLETNDISKSQITSHNDLTPKYRVLAIKKILGNFTPMKIIDVGCGLGYTTQELKNVFPNSKVSGIDISRDGIEYATQRFSNCEFIAEAINPKNTSQLFDCDLICAFEFYPFTRTESLSEHVSYILHLTKGFKSGNKLIIFQLWDNKESISSTYDQIVKHFSDFHFDLYSMPIRKIGALIHSRKAANIVSFLVRPFLRLLTRRALGRNKLIVITKM